MEVKCESCGNIVEASMSNICPHCGNKLNDVATKKKGVGARIKDFLSRFKKARTVAEWQAEAQDAMAHKEFVIASLRELHRCEKADAQGQQQQMQRQQQPGYGYQQQQGYRPQPVPGNGYPQQQGYGRPQPGYGAPSGYPQPQQMQRAAASQQIPKEKNRAFTQATLKDLLDVVAKEQKMN